MKKITLLFLLSMLMVAWLSAQSITITSPKAGETWILDSTKVIQWTYKNIAAGTTVNLILVQGGQVKGKLALNVTIGANGTGSWPWAKVGEYIGGKVGEGSGYVIRIRDTGDKYPVAASGAFSLSKSVNLNVVRMNNDLAHKLLLNTIHVTKPVQGDYKYGDGVWIHWDKTPIANYPQVSFAVYLSDRKTYVGPVHKTDNALKPNTGDYQEAVVLKERYEIGKDYVIRVATPDEKFIGFSGVMHIVPLQAVAKTENFAACCDWAYTTTQQSGWPGCTYTGGESPTSVSGGNLRVGWENIMDDPTGPCWKYIGHVYRTLISTINLYKGYEVTKAVLRFTVLQGRKQNFILWRRDSESDQFNLPATPLMTIGWEFGKLVEVDVTAVVQDWCNGKVPDHGLILRGADESFTHDGTVAMCVITTPQLVITRTVYE